MSDDFRYVGQELDIFARAERWKRYWAGKIRPYLGRRVLEVGAGIGGTTRILCDSSFDLWFGLEPDPAMVHDLERRQAQGEFGPNVRFEIGTLESLPAGQTFDSILYIDVLEHIQDDAAELARASTHLVPGGHLIVLSPAYPRLYTAFDRSIGHFRRYTRRSLVAVGPAGLRLHSAFYLDSVGLLTSLANRLVLHAPMPSEAQILFWDRAIIPVSRVVDRVFRFSLGRSVICIWQKPA